MPIPTFHRYNYRTVNIPILINMESIVSNTQ